MSETTSTVEWLRTLVAVDTTSRNDNTPLIDLVAAELRAHGIEPELFSPTDRTRTGLVATIPAADGTRSGGVVLSAHTDVVPVDGQEWTTDPWALVEKDGRLYGRGVCDMKGYIAAILAALPAFTTARLREPIHIALTYDEEVGCAGGDDIVDRINELGLAPTAALVGEPSSMRAVRAHKSISLVQVEFTGVAAHSSLTSHGVNAVEYAAKLASWWRDTVDGWKQDGPFDEAYPIAHCTGGVNQFHGGAAVNIVPGNASMVIEFRTIAEVSPDDVVASIRTRCDELRAEMKAENPLADVTMTVLTSTPGLDTPESERAVQLAHTLGGIPCAEKVTYGTEGGQYAAGGIPAVICGPGDIAQAHTPDEWIALDQLEACDRYLARLVNEFSL